MSHHRTGHYRWDSIVKTFVKVSESAHRDDPMGRDACWFPKRGTAYYDPQAARWFHGKPEKRAWMREKNVVEVERGPNPLRGLAESRDRSAKTFVVV